MRIEHNTINRPPLFDDDHIVTQLKMARIDLLPTLCYFEGIIHSLGDEVPNHVRLAIKKLHSADDKMKTIHERIEENIS